MPAFMEEPFRAVPVPPSVLPPQPGFGGGFPVPAPVKVGVPGVRPVDGGRVLPEWRQAPVQGGSAALAAAEAARAQMARTQDLVARRAAVRPWGNRVAPNPRAQWMRQQEMMRALRMLLDGA
jgi:hypothetical protein